MGAPVIVQSQAFPKAKPHGECHQVCDVPVSAGDIAAAFMLLGAALVLGVMLGWCITLKI